MFVLQILLLSLFVINKMTQTAESTPSINNYIQRSNVIVNPAGTRGSLEPIDLIRNDCGELCNTSRKGEPGPYKLTMLRQILIVKLYSETNT